MNETSPAAFTSERRTGTPPAPVFGELLIESSWRPTDKPSVEAEGWLRAHGYAPDRRQRG
ncbi:MAG: hypothetical protein K1X89_21445 [Myxococcaceae bacterium]|nr:hypothetical protein [Myxococcaceae bacterium]